MKSSAELLRFFQVLVLGFFICIASPSGVVTAQDGSSPQVPAKKLAEDRLEPFAGAYKEVTKIHKTYEQRIVESSEQAQVHALQQEANDKMSEAVTNHGLTVEDYNKIFRTILNDPVLKEEFVTVLNQIP